MKKKLLIYIILLVGFNIQLKAQPPDPGGGGGGPNCFPPPCIPIDGGLSWLLLAGAVYGGKKAFEINQEKSHK